MDYSKILIFSRPQLILWQYNLHQDIWSFLFLASSLSFVFQLIWVFLSKKFITCIFVANPVRLCISENIFRQELNLKSFQLVPSLRLLSPQPRSVALHLRHSPHIISSWPSAFLRLFSRYLGSWNPYIPLQFLHGWFWRWELIIDTSFRLQINLSLYLVV